MMRRQTTGIALAITAAAGLPAAAQTFSWASPASGLWHVAGNWSPSGIPNSTLADAFVSAPGNYTVTLNANATVRSLALNAGAGVLNNSSGTTLWVGMPGVQNESLITINSTAGSQTSEVVLTGGSTLGGSGTTVLNANPGNFDTARMYALTAGNAASFTQTAGHTIRGSGVIYYGMTNNGSIIADQNGQTLDLSNGQKVNDGTIAAINGATLSVSGEVVQSEGRSLTANGSTIRLANGIITGGSLLATNGSSIFVDGDSSLNSTSFVSGPIFVNSAATLRVGAGIVHDGTITINPTAGSQTSEVVLTGGSILGGSGTTVLNANSGNFATARMYALTAGNAASFIQAAGHTIRGSGIICYDMTNNGSIIADQANRTLSLNGGIITNNAVIESTNNALLDLSNETINGGLLKASGGGRIINSRVVTLNNVSVVGPFDINNAQVLYVGTSLTNDGTITVNTTAGSQTSEVVLTGGSTLGGSGTTVLNANPGNFDTARIYALTAGNGTSFIHAAGHTIRGSGVIYYGVTNNGSIIADQNGQALDLSSGQKVNDGTIAAINGATLRVSSGEVVQSLGRSLTANGSTIRLANGIITGGSVLAANGSSIIVDGTSSLNSTTFVSGPILVNNSAELRVGAGIVHDGTITINSTAGPQATDVVLTGGSTLGGGGTTVLNANPGNVDTARMYALTAGNGTSFIHAVGHTIRGSGSIYYGVTNNGTLSPGKENANAPLNFSAGSLVNTSTAVTNIRLGVSGPLACDSIGGNSTKVLDGTLNVEFAPGFVPPRCGSYTIITGSNITGYFSTVNLPLPQVGVLSIVYSPTSVRIVNFEADYDGDGTVDFFDYDAFVSCFEGLGCPPGLNADFDHDGAEDFFDYDAFVQAFELGC